jgi:hypothetical protein
MLGPVRRPGIATALKEKKAGEEGQHRQPEQSSFAADRPSRIAGPPETVKRGACLLCASPSLVEVLQM